MFGAQVTVTVSDLVGIVISLAVTEDVMIAAVTGSIGAIKRLWPFFGRLKTNSGISRGTQRHIAGAAGIPPGLALDAESPI